MVQFVYNSLFQEIIKMTPFKANYSYCPVVYYKPKTGARHTHFAEVDVQLIKNILR